MKILKQSPSEWSNLRIFHRKITVLGFVTLFFEEIIAFLGLPPSRLNIFEIIKENSANRVHKITEI